MELVSLDQLRLDTRLYADQRTGANLQFIDDTQLNRLINQKCKELYELCIMARPEFYAIELCGALTELDACVCDNRVFVQMPDCPPFFMLLGIEIKWGPTDIEKIEEVRAAESHFYERLTWSRYGTKGYVMGGSPNGGGEGFYLVPGPPALDATTLRIRYIPAFQRLDQDTCDGCENVFNAVDGWDKLVTVGVAIEIANIQQATHDLAPIYAEQLERIQRMARQRNAQEPRRVMDVDPENRRLSYGFEGWPIGPK